MIIKAARKQRGRFHVHSHSPGCAQVILEFFVVFPHAAVGCINRTRPIVVACVAQGGRNSSLQHECRQCRNFGREIVVARSFAPYSCKRKDVIAHVRLVGYSAAFAQEQAGRGLYSAKQIHYQCCVGAAYPEINHRYVVGNGHAHVRAIIHLFYAALLAKEVYVIIEIRKQDVGSKAIQRTVRVPHQPISHDVLPRLHFLRIFAYRL